MQLSSMPLEWLDAGSWRLPSGKALAEFALQAGFLAPLLFKWNSSAKTPRTEFGTGHWSPEAGQPNSFASKHYGKGSGQ